ncbi:hypothetical protein [Desulforapulum autotrophicum]|nr:hypothetical protein [Desulforapulum autotrophicum]
MQLDRQRIKAQATIASTGFLWVTGLLLAGSDNPFMPWTNLVGLVIFLAATVLMARAGARFEREPVKDPSGETFDTCENILFPQETKNGIHALNSKMTPPFKDRRNKWKHPREILPLTL